MDKIGKILWKVVAMVALPGALYGQVLDVKPDGTPEGSVVKAPVPDEQWRPTGTLAFRFKASRTIRFAQDGHPAKMMLVESPVLSAELSEEKNRTVLTVTAASAEENKPKGKLDLSRLEAGRWYHLALAWDAEKGRLEAYLNGVLQEPLRLGGPAHPWKPVNKPSGPLALGGTLGEGARATQRSAASQSSKKAARITVDSIQLYSNFLDEAAVAATLAGRSIPPLEGEGRTVYTEPLGLSPYKLELVYEADFSRPLNVVAEDALFDGARATQRSAASQSSKRRARLPEGKDWVLEGPGRAWTEGGRLHVENHKTRQDAVAGGHVVLWNTRVFPENFLIEFDMSPKDSSKGLNIVFFSAKSREGGGIFDLGLPRREGDFKNYHSGALNCYHVSYWACDANGTHRRTANLRKNFGFFLPACGNDNIAGKGPGPHRVRLLKVGGKIRLETCGVLSLAFDDDGTTYGPAWTDGYIGLRQMVYTESASYTYFKVSRVEAIK